MKQISSEENNNLINEINKELLQEEALKNGKFTAISILGKGTFGVVYRAKEEKSDEYIAIKRVFQDKKYKNRELDILKELNHPNIISLKHFFIQRLIKDKMKKKFILTALWIISRKHYREFYLLISNQENNLILL